MALLLSSLALVLLDLYLSMGAMDSCYDTEGRPQRCMPIFENTAFGRQALVSNTCGTPPEDFCLQMGTRDSTSLCHHCDASDALLHHNATYLTDFHSQEEPTWWQSQSMAFGVQYPNSVNITLHLGKSYEITYVRLKFHTSRPESFAIYKRSRANGPWIPYQYYSASCRKTYGRPERQFLRSGEDEQVAFCTDEFSDISPLSGGNVAFSTLEGRPSAYSFDQSSALQEWVTSTDLLISLNRLNTFGDDIFKDPHVLQSYYYAISDFSVGGRCKCNGHASECIPNEDDQLVCLCQHNTTGADCDSCQPFYQDRPWARGTAESANECLPCNCSGRSEECHYDWELYRRTGHGGHCRNCRDHTAGPHCERCRQNYYRWDVRTACQPCNCNPAGSLNPQCDSTGTCACKATVTGWKCERCRDRFHSLSEGGCRPCACDPAGSVGTCDPNTGHCTCKEKVEGYLCNRCQPGSFNLQLHHPTGCTSCFCYGHSRACTASSGYGVHEVISDFSQGLDGWRAEAADGEAVTLHWARGEIALEQDAGGAAGFLAPEMFLHDQRLSYGQVLSVVVRTEPTVADTPAYLIWLFLEGDGLSVSAKFLNSGGDRNSSNGEEHTVSVRLHEAEEGIQPTLSAFQFQRLLSNVTVLRIQAEGVRRACRISLKEVRLTSALPGLSPPALWVEECICPQGYVGQFCESCAPGFKREVPLGGPLSSCVPCTCNQHGSCDPDTGLCHCLDHTEGASCERCIAGFYGSPFEGHPDDCKPCPCPGQSPCTAMPESGEVVCTQCPPGQRGRLCELCDDGFFGDPLGRSGPHRLCRPCECNNNVDLNSVGNCDPVSGRCLRCLYHTSGDHCERCQVGFYGNPLAADPAAKCTPCKCDAGGSAQGPDTCHGISGQCACLPNVTGRDCSRCQEGYFDLQPGRGCRSCQCHPVGAQHNLCHPLTGQCVCHPGVEGVSCDRCRAGFFGFSFQRKEGEGSLEVTFQGCQACHCSQLGSLSLQCQENGTCVCKRGFVGQRCDQCEANYFFDPGSKQCQECPLCYSLVKEQADRLTVKLAEMEPWLQQPSRSKPAAWDGQAVLGEASRGDSLHESYLQKGAQAAFLGKIGELDQSVRDAQCRLRNTSEMLGCAGHGATKVCTLLLDIQSALQSTQREIQLAAETLAAMELPPEISYQLTNWSRPALEARGLALSHWGAAAAVEDTGKRALLVANTSYRLLQDNLEGSAEVAFRRQMEARYQKIQSAQEELGTKMEEALTPAKRTFDSVHQTNEAMAKDLSEISTLDLRPLAKQRGKLCQASAELEQLVLRQFFKLSNGSLAVRAGLQGVLASMQELEQLWQRASDAHMLAVSSLSKGEAAVSEAKSLLSNLNGMKRLATHPKGQSPLTRKMAVVQGRTLPDAQRKVRLARRVLGSSVSVATKAQKTAAHGESAAREGAKAAEDILRDAKREKTRTRKLRTQVALTLAETSRREQEAKELSSKFMKTGAVSLEMHHLNKSLQETRRSLQAEIGGLNELLASLGNLDYTAPLEAVLAAGQIQLQDLQLHLSGSGNLGQKLSALQKEAEDQQQRIEAFERDLEEIQGDKRNLEAILQSLPNSCASWK